MEFKRKATYAVEGLKPHHILGTQISQMTQILTCSVWDFADFGYFADNLQNFCFFLGGFEENA